MNKYPTSGNQLAGPRIGHRRERLTQGGRDRGRQPRLRRWLECQISSAGDRLFRADDAKAASNGWEAVAGRLGMSRTYRDARFHTRSASAETRGARQ